MAGFSGNTLTRDTIYVPTIWKNLRKIYPYLNLVLFWSLFFCRRRSRVVYIRLDCYDFFEPTTENGGNKENNDDDLIRSEACRQNDFRAFGKLTLEISILKTSDAYACVCVFRKIGKINLYKNENRMPRTDRRFFGEFTLRVDSISGSVYTASGKCWHVRNTISRIPRVRKSNENRPGGAESKGESSVERLEKTWVADGKAY